MIKFNFQIIKKFIYEKDIIFFLLNFLFFIEFFGMLWNMEEHK